MPKSKGPKSGPVFFDLDAEGNADALAGGHPHPADAPPVPETDGPGAPDGRAMRLAMAGLARRPSWLSRAFWGLLLALLGVALSVAAWDFATGLMERVPLLGGAVTVLGGMLLAAPLVRVAPEFATVGFIAGFLGGLFGPGSTTGTPLTIPAGGAEALLPPSYAGGGYTGSGARSGGLDGKGGFPAILHPQETVIDHTKGGVSLAVPVHIHNHTGAEVTAERRDGRIDVVVREMVNEVIGSGGADRALARKR